MCRVACKAETSSWRGCFCKLFLKKLLNSFLPNYFFRGGFITEITKVKDLQVNKNFDSLDLEVVSKGEIRQYANDRGSGKVCNLAAKDATGEIKVTLWNEQCEQVEEGNKFVIKNGWCSEYRGEKQVAAGKKGTLEVKQ